MNSALANLLLACMLACLQGHYVEVGRTEDWNAYLDRMPDQKLQQLGLSRQQVELTRYGKDHVQSVPSEEHSPQLPVR
jgi:hypothetical protein